MKKATAIILILATFPYLYSANLKDMGGKITHGLSKSKEFKAWQSILERCLNQKSKSYKKYGAKGITVCDQWRDSFVTFYNDVGPCPSKDYSIDRIIGELGYRPGNCRWATIEQQNNNRSCNVFIEFNGVKKTLPQWCRDYGLDKRTVRSRIYEHGWSVSDALTKPPLKRGNNRS